MINAVYDIYDEKNLNTIHHSDTSDTERMQ